MAPVALAKRLYSLQAGEVSSGFYLGAAIAAGEVAGVSGFLCKPKLEPLISRQICPVRHKEIYTPEVAAPTGSSDEQTRPL
jgi:hypothetical protein